MTWGPHFCPSLSRRFAFISTPALIGQLENVRPDPDHLAVGTVSQGESLGFLQRHSKEGGLVVVARCQVAGSDRPVGTFHFVHLPKYNPYSGKSQGVFWETFCLTQNGDPVSLAMDDDMGPPFCPVVSKLISIYLALFHMIAKTESGLVNTALAL